MLESLEQSNIKRMSLESPEEDLRFDAEKEFTADDWNTVKVVIEQKINADIGLVTFGSQGLKTALFARELNPNFDLDFIKKYNGPLVSAFAKGDISLNPLGVAELESYLRQCYSLPGLKTKDYSNLINDTFDYENKKFKSAYEIEGLLERQLILKKLGLFSEVNETEKEEVRSVLNKLTEKDRYDYILIAGRMKELEPDFNIKVSPAHFTKLFSLFRKVYQEQNATPAHWDTLLEIAANLKRLNPNKVVLDTPTNIPEQRNF